MVSRRLLLGATVVCLLVGLMGVALFVQQRIERCAAVPLLADQLLPNADLGDPGDTALPRGWMARAPGVQVGAFALDGDRRSLQLMGIANFVQTPGVAVRPGASYCFTGFAITDSVLGSPTRVRATFHWISSDGTSLGADLSDWQPVKLWREDVATAGWSPIRAAFRAPPKAAWLHVRLSPASDDRVYLDVMAVRQGGVPTSGPETAAEQASTPAGYRPTVAPWPEGRRAAVAFTFDWETAMGGLVHSRSAGDPNFDHDPVERGLRMREGITTTLALFRPHNVRATYYANGYNFLAGNTGRVKFMGDPVFTWATPENRWISERWATTPWFVDDPYGTVESHPAWYFADLVPLVRREGHEIQSHTFSHFYGGLVGPQAWAADLEAWRQVAAERGVAPARSLAFPWSSSGGMSDTNWRLLADAGITSVTRLSDQAQYNLFPRQADGLLLEPRCRALPGHEQILACPDFYLTPQSADLAIRQIEAAVAIGGMIDLWAHTEEVVTPEQIAAWERVVAYAAGRADLWVAPLGEIADWQQAVAQVMITRVDVREQRALSFTVTNGSTRDLAGLTVELPFEVGRVSVNGDELSANLPLAGPRLLMLDLAAGRTVEVVVWPAP